jgi:calnexin
MSDGITFDNIYVGHSVEDAQTLATEQWAVKYETEKLYEAAGKEETKKADDEKSDNKGVEFADKALEYYQKLVDKLESIRKMWKSEGPVETIKEFKWIFASAFISVWILISTLFGMLTGGV